MESSSSKKNGVGTTAGAGVNPVSPYKKFKKMQLLDRKISKLTNNLKELIKWAWYPPRHYQNSIKIEKLKIKLETLDQKRKELRLTKVNI
jgi:hypothetical protein